MNLWAAAGNQLSGLTRTRKTKVATMQKKKQEVEKAAPDIKKAKSTERRSVNMGLRWAGR